MCVYRTGSRDVQNSGIRDCLQIHPKTLFEIWLNAWTRVSVNSENCMVFQWAVRVCQRLPSRFGQSGAARELGLVQIVVEASAIRGCFPNT